MPTPPGEPCRLGRTEIEVSRLALGCGNFGGIGSAPQFFGGGETEADAFALMDAAVERGITLFDTADAYGGGRSERYIGNWLRSHAPGMRDRIVLTTKVFHSVVGDAGDRGLSPSRIRRQIEGSLQRLGVDHVDLYLTHEPDPETPIEETLEAFDELVRSGKVRAVGASNVGGAELEEALAVSAERGFVRFEVVQNSYSLLDRDAERDVLPACERHDVAFTAFGPLAGGWLAGRYRRDRPHDPGSRMTLRPEPYRHLETERTFARLDRLTSVARERGTEPATLAIAWLLADARITSIIIGPRRPEHLDSAVAALELELSDEERAELTELFA